MKPQATAYFYIMPTYVYRCARCGEETEAVQKMSDPPLKRCKSCRGTLRRVFQPVGIVLKGSGFHKNDYASKPPPATESTSSSADAKSSESSESKASESKTAEAKPSESKTSESKSDNKSEAKPAKAKPKSSDN